LVESVVDGIPIESIFDGNVVESVVDGILAESIFNGIVVESVVFGTRLIEEAIESVFDELLSVIDIGLSVAL